MRAYAETDLVPEPRAQDLLFCPFCRDCFEGELRCPDHDLLLVGWDALPRGPDEPDVVETDELAPIDPRFGRAELAAGALLLLAGFASPLFTASSADVLSEPRTFTALEAATDQAPNLWTLPFVGVLAFSLVLRRRTPKAMRGARVALLFLSLAVPTSLAYTLYKVQAGAAQMTAARGYTFDAHISWGIAPLLIATLLLLVGSFRFGVLPRAAALAPATADPESDAPPNRVVATPARKRRRRS